MGPVSFHRLGDGLDRTELLRRAELLRAAGIRVHAVDEDRGILVRSEDGRRAEEILDAEAGERGST